MGIFGQKFGVTYKYFSKAFVFLIHMNVGISWNNGVLCLFFFFLSLFTFLNWSLCLFSLIIPWKQKEKEWQFCNNERERDNNSEKRSAKKGCKNLGVSNNYLTPRCKQYAWPYYLKAQYQSRILVPNRNNFLEVTSETKSGFFIYVCGYILRMSKKSMKI